MRRKLVVGNWKMNGNLAQLSEVSAISDAARETPGVDVAICPPVILIASAVARSAGLPIGAQDVHHRESGAHTGNVSAPMLKEAGARLVIVGHSERRTDHRESDEIVRAKAEAALAQGFQTIVCVGESEEEREAGRAVEVVTGQLSGSLPEEVHEGELVIAYEPIWAIGTGKVATPDDAQEVCGEVRLTLRELYPDADVADSVRVLYGGSVKAANVADLMARPDVDGALVGGASLDAAEFAAICRLGE